MKRNLIISSIFLFLSLYNTTLVLGQDKKVAEATENYEQFDYVKAQEIYLAVAEKGYQSEEVFTKLANTYYFNAQYKEAVKWYDSLFNFNSSPKENLIYLRYSQALKAIGEVDKAAKYFDEYVHKSGTKTTKLTSKDYMSFIQQNSDRYELKPLEKVYDENKISFGYYKLGDTLYYASTSNTKTFRNSRSAWDGLSFLSLYTVKVDSLNESISTPKKLTGELKSKFHESSPVFTSDHNTMYFTRSNITSKNKGLDQYLKIYKSERINGKWQQAEELSINSDAYSTAHPALSPDGTKFYFSSDRPGGFGKSDIYVSDVDANGNLSTPVNLGPTINTAGKETFPFISKNNELYFSSDGHFGLGGLDVFYIKIKDQGFGNLLNIGKPINSYADDFAFGINTQDRRGFISSNRSENTGQFVYDNIYSFLETKSIIDVYAAQKEGYVTDKQTGLPISGALVVLTDADKNIYTQTQTDINGHYLVSTNKFDSYFITVTKESYDTEEKVSKTDVENEVINFQLNKNEIPLVPGTDLAKVLNIPIIYFDFDKSNIREDAQVELQKLLTALKEHPDLKIEIRSHTDSYGEDTYNLSLSQRRATSTLNYLVKNGIDASRLSAIGMGETKLLNNCSNGVNCSKEEHQENRRSEFIILD